MCGGSFRRPRSNEEQSSIDFVEDRSKQEAESVNQRRDKLRDISSQSEAQRRTTQLTQGLRGQSQTRLLQRYLDAEEDIPADRARRIRRKNKATDFGV